MPPKRPIDDSSTDVAPESDTKKKKLGRPPGSKNRDKAGSSKDGAVAGKPPEAFQPSRKNPNRSTKGKGGEVAQKQQISSAIDPSELRERAEAAAEANNPIPFTTPLNAYAPSFLKPVVQRGKSKNSSEKSSINKTLNAHPGTSLAESDAWSLNGGVSSLSGVQGALVNGVHNYPPYALPAPIANGATVVHGLSNAIATGAHNHPPYAPPAPSANSATVVHGLSNAIATGAHNHPPYAPPAPSANSATVVHGISNAVATGVYDYPPYAPPIPNANSATVVHGTSNAESGIPPLLNALANKPQTVAPSTSQFQLPIDSDPAAPLAAPSFDNAAPVDETASALATNGSIMDVGSSESRYGFRPSADVNLTPRVVADVADVDVMGSLSISTDNTDPRNASSCHPTGSSSALGNDAEWDARQTNADDSISGEPKGSIQGQEFLSSEQLEGLFNALAKEAVNDPTSLTLLKQIANVINNTTGDDDCAVASEADSDDERTSQEDDSHSASDNGQDEDEQVMRYSHSKDALGEVTFNGSGAKETPPYQDLTQPDLGVDYYRQVAEPSYRPTYPGAAFPQPIPGAMHTPPPGTINDLSQTTFNETLNGAAKYNDAVDYRIPNNFIGGMPALQPATSAFAVAASKRKRKPRSLTTVALLREQPVLTHLPSPAPTSHFPSPAPTIYPPSLALSYANGSIFRATPAPTAPAEVKGEQIEPKLPSNNERAFYTGIYLEAWDLSRDFARQHIVIENAVPENRDLLVELGETVKDWCSVLKECVDKAAARLRLTNDPFMLSNRVGMALGISGDRSTYRGDFLRIVKSVLLEHFDLDVPVIDQTKEKERIMLDKKIGEVVVLSKDLLGSERYLHGKTDRNKNPRYYGNFDFFYDVLIKTVYKLAKLGYIFQESFKESVPPKTMAFIATCAEYIILDHASGVAKNLPFHIANFMEIYKRHVGSIIRLRKVPFFRDRFDRLCAKLAKKGWEHLSKTVPSGVGGKGKLPLVKMNLVANLPPEGYNSEDSDG